MFLIDRINLEAELQRQSSFLRTIEQKLEIKRTEKYIELKVLIMDSIGRLNRKLYSNSKGAEKLKKVY